MSRRYNWVALVAGIASLLLIAVSVFVPWWHFALGNPPIISAATSPMNINFGFLGDSFTIPLLWALNIASVLSLTVGGIILVIYAVFPDKGYSKSLLGFGWNKPVYAFAFFTGSLIAIYIAGKGLIGIDFPLTGSATVQLPASLAQGTNISVAVTTGFEWPFWFALVVAGLCIAARLSHGKFSAPQVPQLNQ